jgi:hypothetical protein
MFSYIIALFIYKINKMIKTKINFYIKLYKKVFSPLRKIKLNRISPLKNILKYRLSIIILKFTINNRYISNTKKKKNK